jgi:hypothetical protein
MRDWLAFYFLINKKKGHFLHPTSTLQQILTVRLTRSTHSQLNVKRYSALDPRRLKVLRGSGYSVFLGGFIYQLPMTHYLRLLNLTRIDGTAAGRRD